MLLEGAEIGLSSFSQAAKVFQKAIDIADREDERGVGQVRFRDQVAYHRAHEYIRIAQQNIS